MAAKDEPKRKRGRPPLPPGEARLGAIALRVPVPKRRRLEVAADAAGRSLSAEVLARIEQSFVLEDQARLLLETARRALTMAEMERAPTAPKMPEMPSALQPGQVFMRAPAIESQQARCDALQQEAHSIVAKADAEERDLTDDELTEIEKRAAEHDRLQRIIRARTFATRLRAAPSSQVSEGADGDEGDG
jgi:hypothetical protein